MYSKAWSSARELEELVEAGEPDPLHRDRRARSIGLSRISAHSDQPGQAQPADSGLKQPASSGAQTTRSPLERRSSSRVTWAPNVPARWWFLP